MHKYYLMYEKYKLALSILLFTNNDKLVFIYFCKYILIVGNKETDILLKDPIFKNIFTSFMSRYNIKIIPDQEVATANLRIDFIIDLSKISDSEMLKYAPYKYLTIYSIGEFKSINDFFNTGDFFRTIGKLNIFLSNIYGYKKNKSDLPKIKPEDISVVFIISGHKKLPKFYGENYLDALEILEKGIFKIKAVVFNSIIIILSDVIELNKYNYPLGMFTTNNFDNFINMATQMNDNFILTYALILYGDKVRRHKKTMAMLEEKGYQIKESIEKIGLDRVIAEVGLDRVIAEVGLDKVIAEVGLDKVIAEVGLDKVIAEVGLDKVIEEVSPGAIIDILIKNPNIKKSLTDNDRKKLIKLIHILTDGPD